MDVDNVPGHTRYHQTERGIETVHTQCEFIKVLFPTRDKFLASFNKRYVADVQEDLNGSLLKYINDSRCVDASMFAESYDVTLENPLSNEDVDITPLFTD